MFTPEYRRIVTTIIKYDKVFRIVIVTGNYHSHTQKRIENKRMWKKNYELFVLMKRFILI